MGPIMNIDLILIGLIAVFGIFGFFSGTIKQVAHWIGAACGYIASKPLAAGATPLLTPHMKYPPMWIQMGLGIVCFYVIYSLAALAVRKVLEKAVGDSQNGAWDKAGGFLLGTGKGAALAFLLMSTVLFFEKPLTETMGKPPEDVQKSRIVAFVREHNFFDAVPIPAMAQAQQMIEASRDPQSIQSLTQNPQLKGLFNDPNLKAILGSGALPHALKSGDFSALRNDPKISALLNDPAVMKQVSGMLEGAEKQADGAIQNP